MKQPIGFAPEHPETVRTEVPEVTAVPKPRPSVVQAYFPEDGRRLSYYNDHFLLEPGDLVYVEGKLAGIQGVVTLVSYNFKIRLEDYKRVIEKLDTHVRGTLFLAGSHYVTFEPETLTREQVAPWFRPPEQGESVTGYDDTAFSLDTLEGYEITEKIAERGHRYYQENKVCYLSLRGTEGYAIVRGSSAYEVMFTYEEGMISRLRCDCFCTGSCKHGFAVLLQLRELLDWIGEQHPDRCREFGCFTAIERGAFRHFVLDHQQTGSITLTD